MSRATPYPSGDLPRRYYRTLDPFVALTAMACSTTSLLVGTGIALLPQRDVIHTAKEVASVDHVSGGRFQFGVGVGWNREEMRNHGTDPRTRGHRMDEMLAALQQIWTSDEAEFHGTYVDFDPIFAWPKPVQRPYPPIFIGWLADHGRPDVPFTVFAAGKNPAALAGFADAGVERVSFFLETLTESAALAELDTLAALASKN